MKITLLSAFLLASRLSGQNSTIEVDAPLHDYGELENIYTLRSDFVLKNNAQKTLYLMRADVEKDVKVLVYKKALSPGDTAHVSVFYQPASTGKFKREVKLVTSTDGQPYLLAVKGNIKSIKNDDKTACFYFGRPNKPNHNHTIIAYQPPVTEQQPLNPVKDLEVEEDTGSYEVAEPEPQPEPEITLNTEPLSRLVYKPNNIVFLADVSGSMRDSSKLPLMKKALEIMVDNLRDIDQVTFITYADSVLLRCEAVKGSDKEMLKKTVRSLHADGYTRGAKAVLFALETAKKNYMDIGNNQVFLATDGKFPFYETHYQKWLKDSEGKDIVLTAVALGNDKDAMVNLKEIARFGKGSFIRIRNFEKDKEALVDEIKLRSKKE